MRRVVIAVVSALVVVGAIIGALAATGTFSHVGASGSSASEVTVTQVRLNVTPAVYWFSPTSINISRGYPIRLAPGATWEVTWAFDLEDAGMSVKSVSVNLPFSVNHTSPALPATFSSAGNGTLSIFLTAPDTPGASAEANVTIEPVAPIGALFAVGNPIAFTCPSGSTYAKNGCDAGDFGYTLWIETSLIPFGGILFEIKTPSGAILSAPGANGFTVVNKDGEVAAQSAASTTLAMTITFQIYGSSPICNGASCGTSTLLTIAYSIVIDMGTNNPTGLGYYFVATGTGEYSGTTAGLSLP